MSIRFEPLTPENYHRAFAIQHTSHEYPWSEKVFSDCLSSNYFAVQLLDVEEVKGFYIGLKVLDEGTLMDIAVEDTERGKGFGQTLLTEFLRHCAQLALKEVWLEVRASNTSAIHLYEKNGFSFIETRKNYYPSSTGKEDAIVMKKVL